MAWDIEPWTPSATNDEADELATSNDDVIDVPWQPVGTDSDDTLEPSDFDEVLEPSNSGRGWHGTWTQTEVESVPVANAEPEFIDAPFTWLTPEPEKAPVKWGAGWFGSNASDDTENDEMERYTAAHLQSEPETYDGYWQPVGEHAALENPYLRSTDDFFRNVETGENESQRSSNPFVGFWSQTTAATSQASDAWRVGTNDTKSGTTQRNRAADKAHTQPREATRNGTGGGAPSKTATASASGSGRPSAMLEGGNATTKSYGWYFITEDDPDEDPDVHALRHWYFLYEYGDGFEEWEEKKFHEWMQSLSTSQYQLYVEAGNVLMDEALVDNLKDGALKTAYLSMRLEGDSPDSERNDLLGRISAGIWRGLGGW